MNVVGRRSHRRRGAAAAAVAFLTVASLMLSASPASSGTVAVPELVVTPADDLITGQDVLVAGTGFLPNTVIYVLMCPGTATSAAECDLGAGLASTLSDANGSFSLTFTMTRVITVTIAGVQRLHDCAVDPCVIGAGDAGQVTTATTPVTFVFSPLPVAAMTVEVNGDEYGNGEAHATGLVPGTSYRAVMCSPFDCFDFSTPGVANSAGEAELSFISLRTYPEALQVLPGWTPFDCLIDACRVELRRGAAVVVEAPVVFPTPEITVTIVDFGTLLTGTNEAVVRATFTCDFSTRVSFHGTVRQPVAFSEPEIVGKMTVNGVPCVGGSTSQVFITTRAFDLQDADFELGPATVAVDSTPVRLFSQGPPSRIEADVELLDAEALVALVRAAIDDPSQAELRAAVIAAIRARVAQDPVFAAEFLALITSLPT